MIQPENALAYDKAANFAKSSKTVIYKWVQDELLTDHEYAERRFIDKEELAHLLSVRKAHNRQNWKIDWAEQRKRLGY
jgi:hypothetical protein